MISKGFDQVSELMGKGEMILTPVDSPIKEKRPLEVETVELGVGAECAVAHQTPLKKQKKEKDPFAPKRFSQYHAFFQVIRPVLLAENPNVTPQDLMKLCGSKWKSLSAEEKAQYDSKAREMNLKEVERTERARHEVESDFSVHEATLEPVSEPVIEPVEAIIIAEPEPSIAEETPKKKKEKKEKKHSSSASEEEISSSQLTLDESKPKKEKKHKKEKKDQE